jgi:hypothetical protein
MVSSPGVGGEGEGDVGAAIGISGGVAVDEDAEDEEDEEGGEGGGGNGCFCSCVSGISGVSSFSEIEAGDEGRDKDAIEEAEVSDSSALGVTLGVRVNATGVPKDDKEDVGEGSERASAAAAAAAPGNAGGGGGGGTISPDTSGSVGNSPKSGNTGKFGMLVFLRDCLTGAADDETTEDVEDG